MAKVTALQLFEQKQVRSLWNEEEEQWYFSIVDVVAILTESKDAQAYWRKLKQRLKAEGNQSVTNCHGLKMIATDGKMRMTDVAEASTKDISQAINPKNFKESQKVAQEGGNVAKVALKELEDKTGKKVVTPISSKTLLENKKRLSKK